MKIDILTTYLGNLRFTLAIIKDGSLIMSEKCTPGTVLNRRNKLINRWCHEADEVYANEIPDAPELVEWHSRSQSG